ncbi:MAG: hypothetical protein HZA91_09665, partial [Verrucomicrobia bacterium]|nr:hypothetical protein [Verrucomicrobiota bacterium]
LKPLGRLRAAAAALARLRPLIEGAQGGPVAPEKAGTTPVAPRASAAAALRPATESRSRAYGGGAHAVLFALVLLGSLGSFVQIYRPHIGIYLADSIITTGTLAAVVVALVKQRGSRMGGGLQGLTWAVMAFLTLLMIVGSVEGFVLGVRNPELANNPWETMKLVAVEKATWRQAVLLVSGLWSAALGLAGTMLLLGFWKSRKLQAAAPTHAGGTAGPS